MIITRWIDYYKENEAIRIKEYYEKKYNAIVVMDFGSMSMRDGKEVIKVNYLIDI